MPDHISKPALNADLTVLCIDGTKASDSAMFAYQLELAGRTIKKPADRVAIQNLLTLVGPTPEGAIRAPSGDSDSVFPFTAKDLKHLPIKKEALPKSKKRVAFILLPQGEVTGPGSTTDYSDSDLGDGVEMSRHSVAQHNSDLLKRLILAPGVSNVGMPSAHLDFANGANVSTDILYLSGHGSMAGVICGEAHEYMDYFELLALVNPEFQKIARGSFASPFWIVGGACFTMRPSHAEVWLRYLQSQKVPLRGLLGFQTTSPLADPSAEICRQFANNLGNGDTFIEAWRKANAKNEKWTAMAFDHAKDDTLTSLRDLKNGNDISRQPPPKDQRKLRFYEEGKSSLVEVVPPHAIMTFAHWEVGASFVAAPDEPPPPPPPWRWQQMLVTNIDFTEETFKKAIEEPPNKGLYVNNGTWQVLPELGARLVDLSRYGQMIRLCPGRIFRVQVFPPFCAGFEKGFLEGDELELTLVHVRQNYKKLTANFLSVFDVVQVNGDSPAAGSYTIPPPDSRLKEQQAAAVRNRIRITRPAGRVAFEPMTLAVRYKPEAAKKNYLWFWFVVRVLRGADALFEWKFDNFVITNGSPHACAECHPMTAREPLPSRDIWGRPP